MKVVLIGMMKATKNPKFYVAITFRKILQLNINIIVIVTKYDNIASYVFPTGLTSGDRLFQAKLFSPKDMKAN